MNGGAMRLRPICRAINRQVRCGRIHTPCESTNHNHWVSRYAIRTRIDTLRRKSMTLADTKAYEFSEMNEFGVILRIQVEAGYVASHLVSEMAFVTSRCAGITPLIISENNITSFRMEQEKYIIDFDTQQTWVLYFIGGNISFTQKDNHTIIADQPYWLSCLKTPRPTLMTRMLDAPCKLVA
uniref:AlNc14C37G3270 protein n=1 Tax=Albugo laibachii Nc14 TaxID=890382 RepID=F0W900_9STRA|nr:AlNc14C37G3270 [Albugo laibachii Nc14]|eukprot:CCA17611.1 AlNc14C37G3270 [Albugo laibachii Nc14]